MDIFDHRNPARMQFYQSLLNSVENEEIVPMAIMHVDEEASEEEEVQAKAIIDDGAQAQELVEKNVQDGMPKEEEVQAEVLVEKAVQVEALVEDEIQAEGPTEEEVQAEALPEEKVHAEALPEEEVHVEALIEEGAQAQELVEKEVPANVLVEEDVQATALEEEEVPATAVVEEDVQASALVEEDVQATAVVEEHVQAEAPIEEKVQAERLIEEQQITPAIVEAPTEAQNTCENRVGAWLSTLVSNEELPQPLVPTNHATWDDNDSGDEEDTHHSAEGTNPFLASMLEEQETEGMNDLDQDCNAQLQMESFMQRIQLREAVPQFALSDSIYWLDKPKDAVSLHDDLPVAQFMEEYKVGDTIKILVSEVYSPFQFWFHICDDSNLLDNLCQQLTKFYSSNESERRWRLPGYLQRIGYLCAVYYAPEWRRARILSEPTKASEEQVSVYMLDYGTCIDVPCHQLYFLHKIFIEPTALVQRGTLTDVYPLDLHWPKDATAGFKRLVDAFELYALIKEIDVVERTFFVSLSQTQDSTRNISTILVDADLAGLSQNYSEQERDLHFGRRLRYVRELLPTFDMLETNVFPPPVSDFEKKFDDIVYVPDFFQKFQPPKLTNPFERRLREALIAWLDRFKPIELEWRKFNEKRRAELAVHQEDNVQRYLQS